MSFNQPRTALAIFTLWCALILGSILIIQPGWGFMDDHSNIGIGQRFWRSPSWEQFQQLIIQDFDHGRFRPVYMLWIIIAYPVAAKSPHLIYFFTTLLGFLLLPVWGGMLDRAFNHGRKSPFIIWIYPLSFAVFTPFWNLFMYISIQEKFVYLLGTAAIYLFLKAYEKKDLRVFTLSLLCSALAMMGKETGIVLLAAFSAYAFTDAMIFKRCPRFSIIMGTATTALLAAYFLFIRSIMKNYTAKYSANANATSILANFNAAPLYIKCLLVTAVISLVWTMVRCWRHKGNIDENGKTLFAWLTVLYILILIPWGFQTYILGPFAAFVMSMGYFYFRSGDHIPLIHVAKRAILVLLAFLTAALIIIPQIQKMADKRLVVDKIRTLATTTHPSIFFYPQPYEETAFALSEFTGADVIYLGDKPITDKDLTPIGSTYLILNDECAPASLMHVAAHETVYANGTWRIFRLTPSDTQDPGFKPAFARNPAQQLKDLLKRL